MTHPLSPEQLAVRLQVDELDHDPLVSSYRPLVQDAPSDVIDRVIVTHFTGHALGTSLLRAGKALARLR